MSSSAVAAASVMTAVVKSGAAGSLSIVLVVVVAVVVAPDAATRVLPLRVSSTTFPLYACVDVAATAVAVAKVSVGGEAAMLVSSVFFDPGPAVCPSRAATRAG